MNESNAHPTGSGASPLRILQSGADTAGALLEVEASYPPHSPKPPEHFHPRQHERFVVLSGEFHARVGGVERTYRAGDMFEIPPGVPHWMHNVSVAEGRLNWQIRPALRSQEMLEAFFASADPARANSGPVRRWVAAAALLRAYRDEFRLTRPPAPVQWLLINTLGRLG